MGAAGNIAKSIASLFGVGAVVVIFGHWDVLARVFVAIGVLAGVGAVFLAVAEARARRREATGRGFVAPPIGRLRLAMTIGAAAIATASAFFVATRLEGEERALVAEDVRVANMHPHFTGPGSYDPTMSGQQAPKTTPRIDVILYNGGERRAVTTRARFVVLEARALEWCGGGTGSLPATGTYDVKLPEVPFSWGRPRQIPEDRRTVEIPFPREISQDGADHVRFRFGNRGGVPAVYRLHGSVRYDGNHELDLGDFLLAVPGIPTYAGYWLLAKPAHLDRHLIYHVGGFPRDRAHAVLELRYSQCVKKNLRTLRTMAGEEGARSSQFDRLRDLEAPVAFTQLTSPTRRPLQLLSEGRADDAISYAESDLEDPALARRCREIAAEHHLTRAKEEIEMASSATSWRLAHGYYLYAIRLLRKSLEFDATPVARRLLTKAEWADRALGTIQFHWSTAYPEL